MAEKAKHNNLAKYYKLLVAYMKTLKTFHNIVKSTLNSDLDREHHVLQFSISKLRIYVSFKMRPDDNTILSIKRFIRMIE